MMHPTSRGWTVLAVLVGSVAMGWQYGPRSLNAVVVPLGIALAGGALATAWVDRPTVTRRAVADGPVGERRTVTIDLECGRGWGTVAATVHEAVGDGLRADDAVCTTLEGGENTTSYDLTLAGRGRHEVGPASITVRDVFGLFVRRFEYGETTPVHVYPRPVDLQGSAVREFGVLVDAASGQGHSPDRTRGPGPDLESRREEFDHLRAYRRGDSLRDVNWKATARRPDGDLVVAEYAADAGVTSITVAADCEPGHGDELATATASVLAWLFESGLSTGLQTENDAHTPDAGRGHRRNLLRTLAVLESSDLTDRERDEADVLVVADEEGTRVVVDGRELAFDRLVGRETESETRVGDGDHAWSRDDPGVVT